jgi:hypothetical protein
MDKMGSSRPEKILLAVYELSSHKTLPCKYEDIVVKAFEMFPEEFQLRGYPKYPDSSDIHKPLYGQLKRLGLIRSANKYFSLTEKGLSMATELSAVVFKKSKTDSKIDRLTRDMAAEIERVRNCQAFQFFVAREPDKILDTDFYYYLGVTVRTGKNDFLGRLRVVTEAVETAAKIDPNDLNKKVVEFHGVLLKKFDDLIQKKTGK